MQPTQDTSLSEAAKQNLSALIDLTNRLLDQHTSIQKNSHLDRLMTYFLFKQLDHACSVMKLDPSADIILIARIMIEGVLNLDWVLKKPDERAQSWFDYACVHDHNLLQYKIANGFNVSDADREKVTATYEANSPKFRIKGKNKLYDNFRCGHTLSQLADECELKDFYDFYKVFSDWVHWGSPSLQYMFKNDGTKLSYYESDHVYREQSLRMAILSLHHIVNIANKHFNLGFDSKLNETLQTLLPPHLADICITDC